MPEILLSTGYPTEGIILKLKINPMGELKSRIGKAR